MIITHILAFLTNVVDVLGINLESFKCSFQREEFEVAAIFLSTDSFRITVRKLLASPHCKSEENEIT